MRSFVPSEFFDWVCPPVIVYWVVGIVTFFPDAFQVFQILLLNNPFKIIAEREAKERAEKEHAAKIRRAKKKAQKRRK